LHSNLLSILLTSAQFFAFFLWFCDRLMCFCHELFLVWRCLVFFTSIFWWWSCGGLSLRSRPTNSANTDLHKAFGNEFTFTHLFENGNV
jgi:hypothetical protein